MSFTSFIRGLLGFRPLPTTLLLALLYLAVIISVVFTDQPSALTKPQRRNRLDPDEAFRDLQLIATLPHPYNSRQNDVVHDFLLERLHAIVSNSSYAHRIQIVDDTTNNATFLLPSKGHVYFEGNNLLVKVEGSIPDLPGVLLSAHYDSVSTAPGATDDGMGVATLLQLVKYFSENAPRRTVVFNINNGEEDGLNGARAFLRHHWSNLTSTFLNLEGAGSGGRSVLFRSSSVQVTKAFKNAPHPHGSSLVADGFAMGLIRSGTDYSVYEERGMKGLDLAFYRRRWAYHTRDDGVPLLHGKTALWSMLENARGTSVALANDENDNQDDGEQAVYFDLFGAALVVFAHKTVVAVNISLLVCGPIIVAALIVAASSSRKLYWSKRGWGRGPFATALSAAVAVALAILYHYVAPFSVHSWPYPVLLSLFSGTFLALYFTLRIAAYLKPIAQQRDLVLLQVYLLWWALLVIYTILVNVRHIGGLYFIAFSHIGVLAALIIGLLEHFELPSPEQRRKFISQFRGGQRASPERNAQQEEEEPTERTALLQRQADEEAQETQVREGEEKEENHVVLWALQVILAVPFPLILTLQLAIVLIHGLNNTIVDGSKSSAVYAITAIFGFLLSFPVAPFAHKLHRSIGYLLGLVFIISTLWSLFADPFTRDSAYKLYFKQEIDLTTGANNVTLTGASPYIHRVLPDIPSTFNQSLDCGDVLGLTACKWEGPQPANIPQEAFEDWIKLQVTAHHGNELRFRISPLESRACRIYFTEGINATVLHVRGAGEDADDVNGQKAVDQIHLWSRTWDRRFDVRVRVNFSDDAASGRVSCLWNEGSIPALEEARGFLPEWATLSKRDSGLVEGFKNFSVSF